MVIGPGEQEVETPTDLWMRHLCIMSCAINLTKI